MDAARKIGASVCVLTHATGRLHLIPLMEGYEVRGIPAEAGVVAPHSPCRTSYPLSLIQDILEYYGAAHTCDEISRDVDETEAALDVRHCVEAYFEDEVFQRKVRILDYGCGAGSSSVTLARLFPHAQILGVDFVLKLTVIARQRAAHYGLRNLSFETVPPEGRSFKGEFDFVFLNAVYEHLLPHEREAVLSGATSALKAGGVLLLNQTPHRWFPIETHTTGLPLLNFLPDGLARWAVRKFCRRSVHAMSWTQLLRAGVRGATVREIMRNIRHVSPGMVRLRPQRLAKSWAGIWYATKQARMHKVHHRRRILIEWAQKLVQATRLPLSPYISIAILKQ